MTSLSQAILRGGRALLVRQVVGLVLSLLGVLVITRLIGPADFGVYTAAFGIVFFAQTIGELSLDVYLVRSAGQVSKRTLDQVFTLLLVLSALTVATVVALGPLISEAVDLPGFEPALVMMSFGIILMHLQQVPLAVMERRLDYRSIGRVEITAQAGFVVVGIACASFGAGVWAPIAAWYSQQAILLTGYWLHGQYRPALDWHPSSLARHIVAGSVTTAGTTVYAVRNLFGPVVLGSALGAVAVGFAALAVRLVEQVGFLRQVIQRLAYAVTGRVAADAERLREAVTRGMEAQVLAVGIPLASFSLIAHWMIPWAFGTAWAPVAEFAPLLVPGFLATAVATILVAVVLGQRGRWQLIVVNGVNTVVMWGVGLWLIPTQGLVGYAIADGSTVVSWLLLYLFYRRGFPAPRLRYVLVWYVAISMVCLGAVYQMWVFVLGLAVLAAPPSSKHAWRVILPIVRSASTSMGASA